MPTGSALTVLRHEEIACDVQAGNRLEMQLLDGELLSLDLAGDGRFQVGLRGHRPETEHFKKLAMCSSGRFFSQSALVFMSAGGGGGEALQAMRLTSWRK